MQHSLRTYEDRAKASCLLNPVMLVLLCSLLATGLKAQVQIVTGKVTDIQGQVLGGATIRVKGEALAVVTDTTGNFNIKIKPGQKLLVSHVNYQPVEVTGVSIVNVKLQTSDKSLDDVIVVGYGRQKKATLTGAVEQIP